MNVISACHSSPGTAIAPALSSQRHGSTRASFSSSHQKLTTSFLHRGTIGIGFATGSSSVKAKRERAGVVCGLDDFWGGDLLGFDLGKWYKDVEEYGSIAVFAPPEGGYEGRYACRLKREGYHFMNMSARGLGDPEAYLTKVHGVRPPHLGKQPIACFYEPPLVDYRLSLLPPNSKGLVLWIIEAQVLSKSELQFLALLPALRPKVKVIAECGPWRKFRWRPLKEVAGLPLTETVEVVEKPKATTTAVQTDEKEPAKILF